MFYIRKEKKGGVGFQKKFIFLLFVVLVIEYATSEKVFIIIVN